MGFFDFFKRKPIETNTPEEIKGLGEAVFDNTTGILPLNEENLEKLEDGMEQPESQPVDENAEPIKTVDDVVLPEEEKSVESRKKLTARQRRLIRLQPKVALGEMTQKEAMLKAGYAETSAREQSAVLGSLGSQAIMQNALREAGMDEEFIAEELAEGADILQHGNVKLAYLNTGAKLLDAVPSQKGDLTVKGEVKVEVINYRGATGSIPVLTPSIPTPAV